MARGGEGGGGVDGVQGAAKKNRTKEVSLEGLQLGEQGSSNYCTDNCMRLTLSWEMSLVQSVNCDTD